MALGGCKATGQTVGPGSPSGVIAPPVGTVRSPEPRKKLGLVVEGYHGNDSIGTGTLPRKAEGIIGSSDFEHSIGSAMVAVL